MSAEEMVGALLSWSIGSEKWIDRTFGYHPPSTPEVIAGHERVRRESAAFARKLAALLPPGDERDEALRLVDRAAMQANAAIARRQAVLPQDTPEPVDEERLRAFPTAGVWADEFAKIEPDADRGVMLGWFANAIEAGKAAQRTAEAVPTLPARVADQLAEAIRLTREYVGPEMLPAYPGWSWYDALEAYDPAYLASVLNAQVLDQRPRSAPSVRRAVELVLDSFDAQQAKHGAKPDSIHLPGTSPLKRLRVLLEEVGEVAEALDDDDGVDVAAVTAEVRQVGAVVLAWLQAILDTPTVRAVAVPRGGISFPPPPADVLTMVAPDEPEVL